MAVFKLGSVIDGTNNPSLDGIFEYGCNNIDHPLFPVGYNKFDTYGYVDGTTTPSSPPYNPDKVLGWYLDGAGDGHCGIAFEHLGAVGFPHYQITPQPFPTGGVYIHPAKIGGGTLGTRNPLIRIKAPYQSTIKIEGTIERGTFGCGTNIGYTVVKNAVTDILARTVVTTTNPSSPVTVSIPDSSLLEDDYIDIIFDAGDDGTDSCDDIAIDFTVTVTGYKIVTPEIVTSRIGVTCESTSLTYSLLLQTEGTLTLYQDGTPIATTPITGTGIVGTGVFTGLDLSDGGELHVIATNTGQLPSDPSTTLVITPCVITLLAPVINGLKFCEKKCDYQRTLTGTANFSGEVFIVDDAFPSVIVATGLANGTTWTVSSSALQNNKKYKAQGIRHDGISGGTITITSSGICEAECVLVGEVTGTTNGIQVGIISAYLAPYVDGELPVANGVIINNKLSIKSPALTEGVDYVFYALKVDIT